MPSEAQSRAVALRSPKTGAVRPRGATSAPAARPFRFVLFVDGCVLLILSASMAVPLVVDVAMNDSEWRSFAVALAITAYVGGALALSSHGYRAAIDRRVGYALTLSAWLLVILFGSLPFIFSPVAATVTDAVFETASGLTTTGSTVFVGLDTMPHGILLWRSMLQWLGGAGIVVTAILLLPILGVGGMQLFRAESSDISDKPLPRLSQIARTILATYAVLTAVCAFAYGLAGMSAFDAINHAMATISTGGFSTRDASIGAYDSVAIECVGIVFMTAGALPLMWWARLAVERRGMILQDRQVPAFLAILAAAVAMVTAWNVSSGDMGFWQALRLSAFNVASVLSDTGFANADFSAWGSFAVGVFFVLMLIGGCAGSTAGGIKVFRWHILFAGVSRQFKRTLSPHRILTTRYGERLVEEQMIESVRNFFFLYIVTILALSLAVMATGLDFLSSTSAVVQAMANVGPGLGPVVGPAGNFASVAAEAKWMLVLAMLLGRLELTTVYVMLFVAYWRR
ncbi:MAG: TrkH family potassium uptake protein [Bauldia sp.]|nr:TrkH family potassium uptake protein [Bauldia sp.]